MPTDADHLLLCNAPLPGRSRRRRSAGRARPLDPISRRGRCRRQAMEQRQGLQGLYELCLARRPSKARPGLRRPRAACFRPRRSVRKGTSVRPCQEAQAGQPVGQPASPRRPPFRAYPPPLDPVGHFLCRGTARQRRDPLRGPAPPDDDGIADAPGGRARGSAAIPVAGSAAWPSPDVGELASPRGDARQCAGRAPQHQL